MSGPRVKVKIGDETYEAEMPGPGLAWLSLMAVGLAVADLGGVLFGIPDPLVSGGAFWSVFGVSFGIYAVIWAAVLDRDIRWQVRRHAEERVSEGER